MRNHSYKNYGLAGLFSLACLFFPLQAQAISLEFVPPNQTVDVNDIVMVDIVVTGLEVGGINQIVSSFDLDVTYNPLVLTATSFTYSSALDTGTFGDLPNDPPLFLNGGVTFITNASLESDADLQLAQGDSVTLGTLFFQAIDSGPSTLDFGFASLGGTNFSLLDFSKGTGNVTVRQPTQNPIPEPSTMLLMGTGSLGLLAWRRWKK